MMIRFLLKTTILLLLFSLSVIAQHSFEVQTDDVSGKPMLVGIISRDEIQQTVFKEWWNEEYENYIVDNLTADEIVPYLENVKIKIAGASWCSDSREQVPRLFKILDYLTFSEKDVELIFVNRDKKCPGLDISNLSIDLVPTFIIYKNNVEAGRIIELPYESLESDILSILYEPEE